MRQMVMRVLVAGALLLTTGAVAPRAGSAPAFDDFERADGPLADGWTVRNGSFAIDGGTAVGSGVGLATMDGASGTTVAVDVAHGGSGLQYTGVVLGYADLANNLFVKVQGDGAFTDIWCYEGNNGDPWSDPFAFATTPFTTARMTVTLEADRDVRVDLTEIDGGAGTASFTCAGAPDTGGAGVGIVGFAGGASVDDFSVDGGSADATPPTVTCDATPSFDIGQSGQVTATVTDEGSGPESPTVSAPADTATAGERTVDLVGRDLAGNETTVSCPYLVRAAATSPTTSSTVPPSTAPAARAVTTAPTYTG